MRVFLAGASGVIGVRLVPLLVAAGHDVAGMTRTPAKADRLLQLGAQPVVCDVFELDALCRAVRAFGPDVVLHQLTDLPDDRARIPEFAQASRRMYREGTGNLVAAAHQGGAARVIAQSIAWRPPGELGQAVQAHERTVLDSDGVAVRYGRFFGPGTYFESEPPPPPRIHIDHAARQTLPALHAPSGVLTVAESDPR